jgi:hypothetical protein
VLLWVAVGSLDRLSSLEQQAPEGRADRAGEPGGGPAGGDTRVIPRDLRLPADPGDTPPSSVGEREVPRDLRLPAASDDAPPPGVGEREVPRDLRLPATPSSPDRVDEADEVGWRRGAVDSSGYRTAERDLDYCRVTPEGFGDLQRGDAPLGLSVTEYREMKADLEEALARDGLTDADVRLQGTAAHFYSRNPDKQFFAGPEAIHAHCDEARRDGDHVDARVEQAAVDRYVDAGYTDGPRPRDKMFDQDHVATGLADDRSDYDIQISSDTLQARMEQYHQAHPDDTLVSDRGGHWNADGLLENFKGLADWSEAWTDRTGRDVNMAGFAGSGPEGLSAFSDEDWVIRRPEPTTDQREH